jgi:alpha-mannosidase
MKYGIVNRIFLALIMLLAVQLNTTAQNENPNQINHTPFIPRENKPGTLSGVEEIVIVYKTHFDIGYSAPARDVIHGYRTKMMDEALAAVEYNRTRPRSEQFVWTIAGWPMKQMLAPGLDPKRKSAMEQAIIEGNLVVHALPFTTHTETLDQEDLVRGLGFSSRITRQYGLPPARDGKMTDVPSHSWIMPTLLTHANINFMQIGGGLVNHGPDIPMLFWWEGPDGSKLLTLYINAYGTPRTPPADWPSKTWLYLSMTGDNEGPPSPETVKRDIDFYKEKMPGVTVKIGKLSDFSDKVIAESPDLPVVRGDMPDTWVHGVMSNPAGTKTARNIRPWIGTLEALNTLQKAWGIYVPDISESIEKAYEMSLLYGEHTWGLAAQHYRIFPYGAEWERMLREGLPANFRALEESWDEHEAYINNARNIIASPLAIHVSTLADNVNHEGKRIVVYNPLPWKRDGMVEVTICYWGGNFTAVKPSDSNETLPIIGEGPSFEGNKYNIIRFMAKDIPPMGYRTYTLLEKTSPPVNDLKADENAATIENQWFRVKFNKAEGKISSIVDKRTNRELVDNTTEYGFGQYLYERFGKADVLRYTDDYLFKEYPAHKSIFDKRDVPDTSVYRSATCSGMTLSFSKNELEITGIMTGGFESPGMPQSASIKVTLYADNPFIDLEVGIEKKPDGWPEAGWICLPFRVDNPSFRLGRNGSVINPVEDIINGSNFRQLWIYSGAAVFNREGGVGICPMDSPLLSLGEPGGRKYNHRYEPQNAGIFVNLYNNQWATNFREWWGGRLTSRVRIWTFDSYDNEAALITPAAEAREPLLAATSEVHPGNLAPKSAGIELSRKGIRISAFGPNPDGEGTILRLWEQAGTTGRCTVTLPPGIQAKKIQPVDLRGTKSGAPINVTDGKFSFHMKGYAPSSFIIMAF